MLSTASRGVGALSIRVAEVTRGFSAGGAERSILERLRNSKCIDLDYIVVNLRPDLDAFAPLFRTLPMPVVDLTLRPTELRKLAESLQQLNPQVVNVHSPASALQFKMLKRFRPSWKLVETVHNIRYRRADVTVLSALTAGIPDVNVAVSDSIASSSLLRLSKRTEVIRLGIDTERVVKPSDEQRRHWRVQLGIPDSSVIFSVVGSFRPQKNQRLALEALSCMSDAHRARTIVVFAGDGATRQSFDAEASERGLLQHIRTLGFVEDGWRVTAGSDVSLLTSKYEGLPLTVMEALSAGVPVVAPAVGGLPEIVTPDCGVLYPVGDATRLARTMESLVADAAVRQAMSASAAMQAANWSARRMADEFEALYARLGTR